MNIQHQAYLLIGSEEETLKRVFEGAQKIWCKAGGCNSCAPCQAIYEKRHYAMTWLAPDTYYTLKQLEPLFQVIRFALSPGEKHIIIIQRADLLTNACANSLLKSLEEPPEGYHFMLLAPRTEGILPTIASRCIQDELSSRIREPHRLLIYFTQQKRAMATDFIKELDKERVPEHEVALLLDDCMVYWHSQLIESYKNLNIPALQEAAIMRDRIERARSMLPMPGSSKLFLKNLFLSLAVS